LADLDCQVAAAIVGAAPLRAKAYWLEHLANVSVGTKNHNWSTVKCFYWYGSRPLQSVAKSYFGQLIKQITDKGKEFIAQYCTKRTKCGTQR